MFSFDVLMSAHNLEIYPRHPPPLGKSLVSALLDCVCSILHESQLPAPHRLPINVRFERPPPSWEGQGDTKGNRKLTDTVCKVATLNCRKETDHLSHAVHQE